MIELMVVLVLLTLIVSFVAPGIQRWIDSRDAAAQRISLENEVAMLPLLARQSGEQLTISSSVQLANVNAMVEFVEPIIVLSNGYCLGGKYRVGSGDLWRSYKVIAPYCKVVSDEQ